MFVHTAILITVVFVVHTAILNKWAAHENEEKYVELLKATTSSLLLSSGS